MFITNFRRAHDLTVEELGFYIRGIGARMDPPLRVSDILLENLEVKRGYKTVPALANLIAEACRATPAQRDTIVLKKYRGTWKPSGKPLPRLPRKIRAERTPTPDKGHGDGSCCLGLTASATHEAYRNAVAGHKTEEPSPCPTHKPKRRPGPAGSEVYAIDAAGNILRKHPSVLNAATCHGRATVFAYKRASGRINGNEFIPDGVTFRYAAQWDAMTPAQRRADVERARRPFNPARIHSGHIQGKAQQVVVIDRQGREVGRFDSVREAWKATGRGVSYPNICDRCKGGRFKGPFARNGLAYRCAEEWDEMTEAQKREYLGLNG